MDPAILTYILWVLMGVPGYFIHRCGVKNYGGGMWSNAYAIATVIAVIGFGPIWTFIMLIAAIVAIACGKSDDKVSNWFHKPSKW